jgi:hypothetical protein
MEAMAGTGSVLLFLVTFVASAAGAGCKSGSSTADGGDLQVDGGDQQTDGGDQQTDGGGPIATPVFGILGDSNTDEYRADDNRGQAPYIQQTLSWMEILANVRGMDFGAWSDTWRDAVRRRGYAFNWARSGDRAADMAADQAPGLAAQIASGAVDHAIVYIGINDWSPARAWGAEVFDGTLSGSALQDQIDTWIDDVFLNGTDVLIGAGALGVVVVALRNYATEPYASIAYPDVTARERYITAIDTIVAQMNTECGARPLCHLVYRDDVWRDGMFAHPTFDMENFQYSLSGQVITFALGWDPARFSNIDDDVGHPHTTTQGWMANTILEGLNVFLDPHDQSVPLLTEAEMLLVAQ